MARIEGVPSPPLMAKLAARFMPRVMKKMTGRDPQLNAGTEHAQARVLPWLPLHCVIGDRLDEAHRPA